MVRLTLIAALGAPVSVLGAYDVVSFDLWTDITATGATTCTAGTAPFTSSLIVGECFASPPAGYGKIMKTVSPGGVTVSNPSGFDASLNVYLMCVATRSRVRRSAGLAAPPCCNSRFPPVSRHRRAATHVLSFSLSRARARRCFRYENCVKDVGMIYTTGTRAIDQCIDMDILNLLKLNTRVTSWSTVPKAVKRTTFTSTDGTCSAGRTVDWLPDATCLPLSTLSGSQKMTCQSDGTVDYQAFTTNDCTGTPNPLGGIKQLETCSTFATDFKFSACTTSRPTPTGVPTKAPTTKAPTAATASTTKSGDVAPAVLVVSLVAAGLAAAVVVVIVGIVTVVALVLLKKKATGSSDSVVQCAAMDDPEIVPSVTVVVAGATGTV